MSFRRYERYKESGVEWLGEVPEHWELKFGRRLFAEKREPSLESDEQLSATQKYGVIPQALFMEMEDQKVVLALHGLGAFKHVEVNDFIISLRSFQGGIEKSHYQGCVSTAYTVLRAVESIAPDYWKHLLKSDAFISVLRSVTDGIREGKSISYGQFASVPLSIPPLGEQEQIAKFLDRETAGIDALIEEQRRLIALLKEKRQAVISHAVTKGLNPSAPMKDSGIEWMGQVPARWKVLPLGYVVRFYSGGTPDKENEDYWNGSVPWISPKDMKVDAITDSQDHITEEAVSLGGMRLYAKNHVLVVVRGMILAHTFPVAVNSVPVTINQDMKAIACSNQLESKFLRELLTGMNGAIVSLADESAHGTLKLETSTLKKFPIPVPPMEEQAEIVDHLFRSRIHYFFLMHNAEHMIGLLQERRSALISAAITGKINVTIQAAKPVRSTWNTGFARQVLAAETLSRCNGPRMGRIKLQKLIHLCEYHAQLDEVCSTYSRKAAGPFDAQAMAGIRKGLAQQRWFEEYKDGSRYAYRPLQKAGGHQQYLQHWADKQARIDAVLNLLGGALTRTCEIASTLYAAWNDLLIEGKSPTDAEIIYEASSAERWHVSKEKIAAYKWPNALEWMRAKNLVPVGYGTHTKHKSGQVSAEAHELA